MHIKWHQNIHPLCQVNQILEMYKEVIQRKKKDYMYNKCHNITQWKEMIKIMVKFWHRYQLSELVYIHLKDN